MRALGSSLETVEHLDYLMETGSLSERGLYKSLLEKNEELNRISVNDYKKAEKMPVVIVLDNIRSLNNIGSIFRTADAFRVEKIYLCGITGRPPHREIHKTALGATESVGWEYQEKTNEAIVKLKNSKYKVVAIEQMEGSINL